MAAAVTRPTINGLEKACFFWANKAGTRGDLRTTLHN